MGFQAFNQFDGVVAEGRDLRLREERRQREGGRERELEREEKKKWQGMWSEWLFLLCEVYVRKWHLRDYTLGVVGEGEREIERVISFVDVRGRVLGWEREKKNDKRKWKNKIREGGKKEKKKVNKFGTFIPFYKYSLFPHPFYVFFGLKNGKARHFL